MYEAHATEYKLELERKNKELEDVRKEYLLQVRTYIYEITKSSAVVIAVSTIAIIFYYGIHFQKNEVYLIHSVVALYTRIFKVIHLSNASLRNR